MSAALFPEDVQFLQRLLRSAGCFRGPITGEWGADTDAAERDFSARCLTIAGRFDPCDERSERNIRTLHVRAQEVARRFLASARATGLDVRIISGTRSYAEQDRLYRIGRYGDTRAVVTRARGGRSNHNFGIAWDIGVFEDGRYLSDSPLYDRAAQLGLEPGLEWGGAWPSFPDRPHYQLATGLSTRDVRARFEAGQSFV